MTLSFMLGLEDYHSDEEQGSSKPISSQTKKRAVKFTVELSKGSENDEELPKPAKRPRTTGAGKSTLLTMLPPPTKPAPTSSVSNENSPLIPVSGPDPFAGLASAACLVTVKHPFVSPLLSSSVALFTCSLDGNALCPDVSSRETPVSECYASCPCGL